MYTGNQDSIICPENVVSIWNEAFHFASLDSCKNTFSPEVCIHEFLSVETEGRGEYIFVYFQFPVEGGVKGFHALTSKVLHDRIYCGGGGAYRHVDIQSGGELHIVRVCLK